MRLTNAAIWPVRFGAAAALSGARRDHVFEDLIRALVDLLEPEMERTACEIADLGRKTLRFAADVADHKRAKEIVDTVVKEWSRIDFLLNNAGKSMPKPMIEITEEEFDRTIAINLKSCFNYIHATAPVMLRQGVAMALRAAGMEVVFEAGTAEDLFRALGNHARRVEALGLLDAALLLLGELQLDPVLEVFDGVGSDAELDQMERHVTPSPFQSS